MKALVSIICSLSILQAKTHPSPSDPQATEEVKILLKAPTRSVRKGDNDRTPRRHSIWSGLEIWNR